MSDPAPIPLASAIRALRAELQAAVRAGENEELRFALGPVELELQVEAACEGTLESGIKFWLVSVGAKGSRSSGATHTMRLSLTPVRVGALADDGRDVLVASELEERG
jgi:Trypsin-co-occurring domain 2